jgi:hypothetical protein
MDFALSVPQLLGFVEIQTEKDPREDIRGRPSIAIEIQHHLDCTFDRKPQTVIRVSEGSQFNSAAKTSPPHGSLRIRAGEKLCQDQTKLKYITGGRRGGAPFQVFHEVWSPIVSRHPRAKTRHDDFPIFIIRRSPMLHQAEVTKDA